MNILILSCGTRFKLVSYFKNSKSVNKVVCTDINNEAPALLQADKSYIVPRMTDPHYLDEILRICRGEDIDAALPLHEEELLLISKNKHLFKEQGILPVISDYESVSLCKDKYLLSKRLIENNIPAVETFPAKEYNTEGEEIDVFVKPRNGAGSSDTFHVSRKKMLEAITDSYDEEFIVQRAVKGKEYGVDIYADMITGEVVSIFCKEKIRMRAGETEKSISVKKTEIERIVKEAVKELALRGPIDMDVLEENGKFFILEINPRFGGGYPHAYECGVDFISLISNNAEGNINKAEEFAYKENILGLKYSDIVTVNIVS